MPAYICPVIVLIHNTPANPAVDLESPLMIPRKSFSLQSLVVVVE